MLPLIGGAISTDRVVKLQNSIYADAGSALVLKFKEKNIDFRSLDQNSIVCVIKLVQLDLKIKKMWISFTTYTVVKIWLQLIKLHQCCVLELAQFYKLQNHSQEVYSNNHELVINDLPIIVYYSQL